VSDEDNPGDDDVSTINPELKAEDTAGEPRVPEEAIEAAPKTSGHDVLEYELPSQGDDDEVVASEPSPYDRPGLWYVVHTYAGYENKVKSNLESRISSMNMEDRIFEVVIPMEEVAEIKGGKRVFVQRKVFPGYLLCRCDLDDDSWSVIRQTPGVTGFVGPGSRPPCREPRSRRSSRSVPKGSRVKSATPSPASSTRLVTRFGSRKVRSPTSQARLRKSTRTN